MITRADRNNNPTNIKVPSGGLDVARQRYGDKNVSVDPTPAADGGQFLKFSTPEYGTNATTILLKNPLYQDMTVDKAMKTWSGGGYGGDIAPALSGKKVSELSDTELGILGQNMARREGYTGQNKGSSFSSTFRIPTANAQTMNEETQSKMSLEDFGKLIQSKYPEYAGKDARLVGQKTLEKYPVYASKVDIGTGGNTTNTSDVTQPNTNNFPYQVSSDAPSSETTQGNTDESNVDKLVGGANKLGIPGQTGQGIKEIGGAIAGGVGNVVQGGVQLVTNPFMKIISSLKGLGQEGLSIATQLMGDKKDSDYWQQEYEKNKSEGTDYGYLGKVKPMNGVIDAMATGALAGLTAESVLGLGRALLTSTATKVLSKPVIQEALGVAKVAEQMIAQKVPSKVVWDTLAGAIKTARPSSIPEIEKAISQLAGPSFAKKLIFATGKYIWTGTKWVLRAGADIAGLGLLKSVIK